MTEYKQAQEELKALYAEIPSINCQRKCQDSCGPILMSRWEWARIRRRVKDERKLTLAPRQTVCPLLSGGACSVHHIRPTICRLWGVVESMPCPWGCKPDRYLSHFEGKIFLARAELVGTTDKEERLVLLEEIEWLETHPEEEARETEKYRRMFAIQRPAWEKGQA